MTVALERLVERLRERTDKMDTRGNASALREAANAIERILCALGHETECPCCSERETCADGCTFEDDCPDEYKRMLYMRSALTPNAD